MSKPEAIVRDEIVYVGCACNCFVKITGQVWNDNDRSIAIDYGQTYASDYIHRSSWRSRLKRVWLALRNDDWNTGFEIYDDETATEFAEKFAEVVWHTFPSKPIDKSDEN